MGQGSGQGPFDFALVLDSRVAAAPHVVQPGQAITVRPALADARQSVIDWGDGQTTFLQSGWRSDTPAAEVSHSYAEPGAYRVEYIAQAADGSWGSRTLPVAVVAADAPLAPVPAGCAASTSGSRRVLFVGNSQISVQNVPRIVASIAASAPADCPRLEVGSVTLGGANLSDLWQGGAVETALRSGQYDTVVIAESIELAVAWNPAYPATFFEGAGNTADLAQSLGMRVILYATPVQDWLLRDAEMMAMATYNAAMARTRGHTLAAGGMAWLQALNQRPSLGLYYSDNAHSSYMGATLSSFVLYAAITGASPVGLAASPVTDGCDPACEPIEPTLAHWLQQVAWTTYLNTR